MKNSWHRREAFYQDRSKHPQGMRTGRDFRVTIAYHPQGRLVVNEQRKRASILMIQCKRVTDNCCGLHTQGISVISQQKVPVETPGRLHSLMTPRVPPSYMNRSPNLWTLWKEVKKNKKTLPSRSFKVMITIFTPPLIWGMGDKSLRKEQRKSSCFQRRRATSWLYYQYSARSTWRYLEGWQTCQGLSSCLDTQVSREHPWPECVGRDTGWTLCTITSGWGSGMDREGHDPVVLEWKM